MHALFTSDNTLPTWVPDAVRRYLDHTHGGKSLRDLAREDGCHASTIMRQVRRFENRRDDPLVDELLDNLGRSIACAEHAHIARGTISMNANVNVNVDTLIDEDTLEREARRVLRRLCEPSAVLVLAMDLDKAAVLRGTNGQAPTRTAVVERAVAQALALKDWIACERAGRVASYKITTGGRAALKRFLADDESKKRVEMGFSENVSPFTAQHIDWDERNVKQTGDKVEKVRYNICESPLSMLSRRRDKAGKPFLDQGLVQAGERFREDFELAQMGPRIAQNWDRFLTTGDRGGFGSDGGVAQGPASARARVLSALEDLGPGLGDIIMRCCCFLEGLEAAEKRMGWSARSGKVVLRIALQRLRRHYQDKHGAQSAMIG
ncbi:MAG: DUF6456 domain-containing protein [Litoreibacter sp.]